MYKRQTSKGKSSANHDVATNQFAPRPFVIQTQTEEAEQTPADLQAKSPTTPVNNLANIPIFPPGYQPPSPPRIQMKLTIGEPGDKYEQEADKLAKDVVQRINTPESESIQPMELSEDEDQVRPKSIIQKSVSGGASQEKSFLQLKQKPQLTIAATQMIQMERENEFKADPEDFMNKNVVSLTMKEGLFARFKNNAEITKHYDPFVKKLGSFTKHWFKLIPDAARNKEDQAAYILTPAIEKYLQEYPEDELLAQILGKEGIPAIESDDQYIQSAFVEYKPGKSTDAETDVGHTTVTKDMDTDEDFNPDFVFTAAMNGCAFVVTPAEDDQHFEAWHYQSPESNLSEASAFRKDKQPMDWYGAEEYDDGQHQGLFEVTNLLHRDKNNNWNILSQQNETSSSNPNEVQIKNVHKRPLNLQGDNKFNITQKLYESIIESKKAEIQTELDKVNNRLNLFKTNERESVQNLTTTMMNLLNQEINTFNAATTLLELNAAGRTIKTNRENNWLNISQMISSLRQHFLVQYTKENNKMFKSADKISAYNLSEKNLELVNTFFNKLNWIEGLISETAP